MPKLTIEFIKKVAEELMGTCASLDDKLNEYGIDFNCVSVEMNEALDDEVMLCEYCGWWRDPYDLNDEGNCEDCREDDNEETTP